jgi:hypothetical protein
MFFFGGMSDEDVEQPALVSWWADGQVIIGITSDGISSKYIKPIKSWKNC